MSQAVRAPGKAILAGEYAVLHGAPAIAVAVDREVVATQGAGGEDSPFVRAAAAEVARRTGTALGPVRVDSSALYAEAGQVKLGLGSSAAVTAAVVGLGFACAGRDLEDRAALFAAADAAHAAGQGTRGSGIDIACSLYGGAIRFQRPTGGGEGRAEIRPVSLPAGVELTFFWTERPASTAALLRQVQALAAAAPARHATAMARLTTAAHAFADAVAATDGPRLIAAAAEYGAGMAALGEAAGAPIMTEPHARFAALAGRHGGAAKPSGAGGGDLGVAFTLGAEATQALRAEARGAGFLLLSLGAGAPGLRLENQ